MRMRMGILAWAVLPGLWQGVAVAQTANASPAANASSADVTLDDVDVVARRLDLARCQIEPSIGATRYDFGRDALDTLPQGDDAPLNQVMLQAPGVAQDSFGQIHVRGDHANVQYRLDGVQLPEGLSGFGQALSARFADSMALITGALPAEYGFQQAGAIDIQTRSGAADPGGEIGVTVGSRGVVEPNLSYGGRAGTVDYFLTLDGLHTGIGIENPTGRFNARHDDSDQFHGLINLSDAIDGQTRLSLIAGSSLSSFQLPNNPGQTPALGLNVNGNTTINSATLNERQREATEFAILSLQKQIGDADLQLSAFTRNSSLVYSPDVLGDLLFNGIAQYATRTDLANGVQADASWAVNDRHTLRAGLLAQIEQTGSNTSSLVLPLDASGNQTSDQPFAIDDNSSRTGGQYGVYIQDEWRLLPTLTLNYGLRFDAVNEYTDENQLSPRINLVWQPADDTSLHAGYARYFTPPPFELVSSNTLGLFNNTTGAASVAQDSPVKAERSHYFDVGVSRTLLPGLTLGVDAYDKQARNLIDEGQFGAPIILSAFNYAKAQVWGVEWSGSYVIGPWSLYGNLALSRAVGKDIDSAQFNFSPDELAYIAAHYIYLDHDQRWSGSAGAAYTFRQDSPTPTRLSVDLLGGSGLRASTATIPNGRGLPAYAVFNISVVQKLDLGFGKGTEARLDVLNVADEVYEIRDGTGVGVGAPQYGLRRTILAGIKQKF
jgi:outer membrane receptor protein involved in Fe transport